MGGGLGESHLPHFPRGAIRKAREGLTAHPREERGPPNSIHTNPRACCRGSRAWARLPAWSDCCVFRFVPINHLICSRHQPWLHAHRCSLPRVGDRNPEQPSSGDADTTASLPSERLGSWHCVRVTGRGLGSHGGDREPHTGALHSTHLQEEPPSTPG